MQKGRKIFQTSCRFPGTEIELKEDEKKRRELKEQRHIGLSFVLAQPYLPFLYKRVCVFFSSRPSSTDRVEKDTIEQQGNEALVFTIHRRGSAVSSGFELFVALSRKSLNGIVVSRIRRTFQMSKACWLNIRSEDDPKALRYLNIRSVKLVQLKHQLQSFLQVASSKAYVPGI
jgi:hypothetical protein